MAEQVVVVDTQNDTEPIIPEGETAEQKLVRLTETNKKLYERAKSAEAQAKELKAKIPLPTSEKPEIKEDIVKDIAELKQSEKKRQFGYRNNLSPEETDLLFRFAGSQDPTEAMKEEDFKDLLEARRRRTRVAEAIPSSSNRVASVGDKTFKDMSSDERQKNWKKLTRQE